MAGLLVWGTWLAAGTQPAIGQKSALFAEYEDRLITRALGERNLTLDPHPEGKQVEALHIAAYDMFLAGELPLAHKIPWTWLNKVHVRTKDHIIAQEILQPIGEPYRQDLIDETGRNLRNLFILAVARLVAVRGTTPDRVGLLVITKDRWTLRLNTSFVLDGARLDALAMSMAESNLFGRAKRVAFEFSLDPGRYGLGGSYLDPRIAGSRHSFRLLGLFYLTRGTGGLEGGKLDVSVGRPLFSLQTRLGWQVGVQYLQDIARQFRGGDIRLRELSGEQVPDVYTRRNLLGNAQIMYSLGVINKVTFALGFRVSDAQHDLPADFPSNVSEAARTAYQALLPRSESWAGPFVHVDLYTARYLRVKNLDSFSITEDLRIGPKLNAEVRVASHVFGLPSDFVELWGNAEYTALRRDVLVDAGVSVGTRVQPSVAMARNVTSPMVNQAVHAYLHVASPLLRVVRLHGYGAFQLRARDLSNARLTLGLDNGLRGYATRAFQGNGLYHYHVETRTLALNLWTVYVGGVVFYDAGDAPPALLAPHHKSDGPMVGTMLHQDAGIGLRLLFPQFNREVLRLDLAFPFEPTNGHWAPRFSAEFGQAF